MPKATYMYWQKRFDRENPDKEIEEKMLKSHKFLSNVLIHQNCMAQTSSHNK